MLKRSIMLVVVTVAVTATTRAQDRSGVPNEYTGDWVCQTFQPGYNILPPHADTSQPQGGRITTPSTVMILKFSLRNNGTYSTANATGHYTFDPSTRAVTWLDGPHQNAFSETELGRRKDGAPSMGFVTNKRRYGCFIAKPR